MLIIKQFDVRKCGHEKNPIAANDCLLSLIKNNNNSEHYFIATQDMSLSKSIRNIPGCPLLYMKLNTIVMEKPSEMSEKHADELNARQTQLTMHEMNLLKQLKHKELGESEESNQPKRKKRKGPKGPNPLSCKKKKKTNELLNKSKDAPKSHKQKRKRGKMSLQINKLLNKINSNQ